MTAPPEILIDARGHRCPVPTLKLARAMGTAAGGTLLRLLTDDPMARIDVPHFCARAGFTVLAIKDDGDRSVTFLVEKPSAEKVAARRLGNDAPPG